ncbi:MAG: mannosyltransferase [Solirubrobacteraceae bacterium]|jgi:hypothetical protein|nr:mannosyltransferase [Solirubrobacteraceae bacterium]
MARTTTVPLSDPSPATSTGQGRRFVTSHWAPLTVGLFTVVALVLRLVLATDSLLGDELFMYQIVHHRSLGDMLHVVRETEKTPPLFFVLVWAAGKLGPSTEWVRAPSILFGTALVPLVYLLGQRTVGRVAGVVAAVIVALSPFAVFYGTEARAYGALAFLAGLSTLCLLNALESDRRGWWAAYGLAVVAVLYTHYMGVFVLGAQAVWAFAAHRERFRSLLVVHALVLLAFLPWLPSFLLQESHSAGEAGRIALLRPPTWSYFGRINAGLLFGHPFLRLPDLPGRIPVAAALLVVAVGAAAAVGRAARAGVTGLRWTSPILLVVLLALATPVGVRLVSLHPDRSFMLVRNLSASLPAFALLAAWLVVGLPRRLAVVGVAVVLAVVLIGTVKMFNPDNRRSNYRAAAEFIETHARPGDPVIQTFFLPAGGALGKVLSVNFQHPHPLYRSGPPEAAAWARGRRGADVFVLYGLGGFFKGTKHAGSRAGPGKAFRLVREARYRGFETVLVGEYRYAPR